MPARRLRTALLAAVIAVGGCAETLDWREFVPEGTDLSISFPCRPDRVARKVMLAGAPVQMNMLACSAGDATFALAFVDVADPAKVADTLAALRQIAVANLQDTKPHVEPVQIRGMTPNAQAARLNVTGRLPDGAVVQEHAAFFVRGVRAYQASVIGAQPTAGMIDVFMAGLKFPT